MLTDQNDQFAEIGALRRNGVRTIGRFVWESFAPEDAGPARDAYETIYSFTRAEQERYRGLGIESPLLTWGCHPELIAVAEGVERSAEEIWFYVPGSFMGKRKPFPEIVESFVRARGDHLRLLIRGQVDRKAGKLEKAAGGDPRVRIELEDRPTDEHLRQFAGCHVCLSPSRWEGLGLPLYEAVAFGMPSITNDSPPMNEIVLDGVNGICVDSVPWGEAGSGIPAFDPDFAQLTEAIERLGDRLRARAPRRRRDRAPRRRALVAANRRRPPTPARALMRVGVVTKWFNRGQPVVGRQLRSALDQLGHQTFVLARPKKERGPRPGALDRDDVWDQPGITEASAYDVTLDEYERWVGENGIEAVFCDQNYQFDELAQLRARGVLTVGRFVWEHFTADHVAGAREAYDVVYSLTRAEQERYRTMGLETPYVSWGCHPELIEVGEAVERPANPETVTYVFPGGFLGHRKPLEAVLEAFEGTTDSRLRLVVKAQVDRKQVRAAGDAAARDPRIELRLADQPTAEHLREVASCDVTVAPARWEGLGLPLYEAIAFGMPAVTNDAPPMNEAIADEVNGLLVGGTENGTAKSGIPALDPDVGDLRRAIERLADDALRAELAAGAVRVRDSERRWEDTVSGIGALLTTTPKG